MDLIQPEHIDQLPTGLPDAVNSNVIIQILGEEERKEGGIWMHGKQEVTCRTGKVLSVAKELDDEIKVGDTIVYSPASALVFQVEGVKVATVERSLILAVIAE